MVSHIMIKIRNKNGKISNNEKESTLFLETIKAVFSHKDTTFDPSDLYINDNCPVLKDSDDTPMFEESTKILRKLQNHKVSGQDDSLMDAIKVLVQNISPLEYNKQEQDSSSYP